MAAVRAEDHIGRAKVSTHSHSDGFLAHVCVAGTVDEPALVRPRELLFATANQHHLAIKLKQYFTERQSGTGRHDPKSPSGQSSTFTSNPDKRNKNAAQTKAGSEK
jgi:hypothetical protein